MFSALRWGVLASPRFSSSVCKFFGEIAVHEEKRVSSSLAARVCSSSYALNRWDIASAPQESSKESRKVELCTTSITGSSITQPQPQSLSFATSSLHFSTASSTQEPPDLDLSQLSSSQESRSTESEDQNFPGPEPEAEDTRKALLNAALEHVKEKGWTHAALVAGAHQLGLSPAVTGILERGEAELVEYFVETCNADLASRLQGMQADLQGMPVTLRIRTAVKMRLEMLVPYIDSWPAAMAIQARPGNVRTALRQLALLVDDVWHAAGDSSTDLNWYTKRALLAGVYTSTELYMLTDFSPEYRDTWAALDRRLQDVKQLGKLSKEAGSLAAMAAQVLGGVGEDLLKRTRQASGRRSDAETQQEIINSVRV